VALIASEEGSCGTGFVDDVVLVVEYGAQECEPRDTKPLVAYGQFRVLTFGVKIWATAGKRQVDKIDSRQSGRGGSRLTKSNSVIIAIA
jgi:hypothetical protein